MLKWLVAAFLFGVAVQSAWPASGIVGIFEARFGAPGTMHVAPECSCTFKYLGTKAEGADYYVHFRKMD